MNDPEFLGDKTALLRPDETYDPKKGYALKAPDGKYRLGFMKHFTVENGRILKAFI